MKKKSLKTQMSLTIGLVVLITVGLISILSNVWISQKFKAYIADEQVKKSKELVENLSLHYNADTDIWDTDHIHTLGMYALYDGFIIKVYDTAGQSVWDAQKHDMNLCTQVMAEISERMQEKYPRMNGEFITSEYGLYQSESSLGNESNIGSVNIMYYGPYFLNESDFQFLDALNTILLTIGSLSLIFAIIIGWFMANKISRPISKTADIAREIAAGNYEIRFEGGTRTKELDALVLAVNELAGSLNEQEKIRKRLTADVAHELRTPLTTVATHIEAMTEGIWEPTPKRLESCYEEINRMTTLVKDLENLAKAENESLNLEISSFSLKKQIDGIIDGFEAEIQKKKLSVAIEGDSCIIEADKDRICQVIRNLLSNAVKYSHDNGRIDIKVQETIDQITLDISDNGIGISKCDIPYIFERFYRADKSRNRSSGGAGIGLAIVKAIIAAHDGKITVESELERGTKFIVKLPKFCNK